MLWFVNNYNFVVNVLIKIWFNSSTKLNPSLIFKFLQLVVIGVKNYCQKAASPMIIRRPSAYLLACNFRSQTLANLLSEFALFVVMEVSQKRILYWKKIDWSEAVEEKKFSVLQKDCLFVSNVSMSDYQLYNRTN